MRTSLTTVTLVLLGSACRADEPTPLATLPAHKGAVRAVAFSPSGDLFVSAGDDGCIRLWEMPSHKIVTTLAHGSPVLSVAFSDDGRILASGAQDGTIKLWRVKDGTNTLTFRGRYAVRQVLLIGEFVQATYPAAFCLRDVYCYDMWNSTTGQRDQFPHFSTATASGFDVQLEPEGSARIGDLLQARTDIRILDKYGRQIRFPDKYGRTSTEVLRGHADCVNCMAVASADHTALASCSDDGTIKFWDVAAGTCTATLHANQGAVYGVAFTPNGRVLTSGGADGTVKFWLMHDAATHIP
jgi:WD40 repeat protein